MKVFIFDDVLNSGMAVICAETKEQAIDFAVLEFGDSWGRKERNEKIRYNFLNSPVTEMEVLNQTAGVVDYRYGGND